MTPNTLRYRIEFARVADAFKIIGHQGTVFDGGCGSGEMLKRVYQAGYCDRGIGMEYTDELFAILKENYRGELNLTPTQGSLLEVHQPDESVDCAMSTQVLEHIEDHVKAAGELARVVKPGGYLIVSVPHPPEPFPNPEHMREGYLEKDLVALFPEPRFKHLATRYFFTRPTVNRMMAAHKWPFDGKIVPLFLIDQETHLSDEERKAQTPFGILGVFQKLA